MPVITWKRAVAIALAVIAAGVAVLGLVSGSLVLIASSILMGGTILLTLIVAVYRRVGYQTMLTNRQEQKIESIRNSVHSAAKSNVEVRKFVREMVSWQLHTLVLGSYRDIISKTESLELRLSGADRKLREINRAFDLLSQRIELLESEDQRLREGVNGIKDEVRDLTTSLADLVKEHQQSKKLFASSESVENIHVAVLEGTKRLAELNVATDKRLGESVAGFKRLDAVPGVLESTTKKLTQIEKKLELTSGNAREAILFSREQSKKLENSLLTPMKRLQKEFDKGALRFSLVNDMASLVQLEKQLQLRSLLPAFSSWTLEPIPLARIVEIVLKDRPQLIVECGSGLSTLLLAYAAEQVGGKVVALEHLAQYAEETRSSIRRHGLEKFAEVREAALERNVIEGQAFDWYAKSAWSDLKGISLLMVDGPPMATGELARYPAIPLLAPALTESALVVIDDTHRRDERAIVERWQQKFVEAGEIFDLGVNTSAFYWGRK